MTVGITTLHLNVCVSCINHIICQVIMSREAARRLKSVLNRQLDLINWKVGICGPSESPENLCIDSGARDL